MALVGRHDMAPLEQPKESIRSFFKASTPAPAIVSTPRSQEVDENVTNIQETSSLSSSRTINPLGPPAVPDPTKTSTRSSAKIKSPSVIPPEVKQNDSCGAPKRRKLCNNSGSPRRSSPRENRPHVTQSVVSAIHYNAGPKVNATTGTESLLTSLEASADSRLDITTSTADICTSSPIFAANSSSVAAMPPKIVSKDNGGSVAVSGQDLGHGARKLLQLNPRTGTIGSPPAQKAPPHTAPPKRKRKSRVKSLYVKMCYGVPLPERAFVGARIQEILAGRTKPGTAIVTSSIRSNNMSLPHGSDLGSQPLATDSCSKHLSKMTATKTHPFFEGAIVSQQPPQSPESKPAAAPRRTVETFSSPSKLASIRAAQVPKTNFPPKVHTFGQARRGLRIPGSSAASWPSYDAMHVRGDQKPMPQLRLDTSKWDRRSVKSKYRDTSVSFTESVAGHAFGDLILDNIKSELQKIDCDDFAHPSADLRLPDKYTMGGRHLQQQVTRMLSIVQPAEEADEESSADELRRRNEPRRCMHRINSKLWSRLRTELPASDLSCNETQIWCHKYAPTTAAGILQVSKAAFILSDWLQALTVKAVESAVTDSLQTAPSSQVSDTKKRRRRNKLDGFIVNSDEDDEDELMEVMESEEISDLHNSSQRTVVRTAGLVGKPSRAKLCNVVVISGPSGCGKTAMIQAIAKELDFEIFELNPGGRRSGKDILDRVGDMTRNHLVQGHRDQDTPDVLDTNLHNISGALVAELESGRQATMNSFFKPKSKASTLAKSKASGKIKVPAPTQATKQSQKLQRQSLILLEEADILYEEDKQFWPTVVTLSAQSKRPIVITCNEEATIPLIELQPHAIIRLKQPPLNVLVDHALLIAANEDHSLCRSAVEELAQAKRHDMRAVLMELQAWCQKGVGDRRNGMEWHFLRWPPGSDKTADGETIRVVSQNTYLPRMNWLPMPSRTFERGRFGVELEQGETLLREAWSQWGIDPFSVPLEAHTRTRIPTLTDYEECLDLMSLADICSAGYFAHGIAARIDKSSILSEKARNDYIMGRSLLHADVESSYDVLAQKLSACMIFIAASHGKPGSTVHLYHNLCKQIITPEILDGNSKISHTFLKAFGPIASSDSTITAGSLDLSTLQRTTNIIATDVAPYVRSIVAYDHRLSQERARLSTLLSEGGTSRPGKRMRTTRAAMSALEGGARSTTRKERYFTKKLDDDAVLLTGAAEWQAAAWKIQQADVLEADTPASSLQSVGVK